ncbi:mpv17-like protein [Dermatophagoides farinae]|uniref:Mpv17-like protein n=1 Tax=Dermatophagoides farinae TaxID=6954 RepID=A0A9D4P6W6_DERFA|nr:mpv17-like protein 2 [Dermatophagoides farinae]XP_046919911.1 mpv17-like protein 2 [Dermatophagoides farinae]KAH7644862.1 mpv17-like protein [Dermatophagoides farinae]
MRAITWSVLNTVCNRIQRTTGFIHSVIFGRRNLLLTNALISASMGAFGDSIQQNFDILINSVHKKDENRGCESKKLAYSTTRTIHMTIAGLSTGVLTHYWYLLLERVYGKVNRRRPATLIKLVLLDQILFSPVNLFVYFGTLSLCERSGWKQFRQELLEKGMENIYVVEWLIWPPAQLINFALLPLRYRILFDNIVSLGFDIYGPYVKYKKPLSNEKSSEQIDS